MAYQSARDRYRNDGAGVVSQPRLLVMVFDRLVLDLEQAEAALQQHNLEVVSTKLCHAQTIILELHSALDLESWEGAAGLGQLYLYFNNELMAANVNKDAGRIRSCLGMLRELQQAWHQAHEETLTGRPADAAPAAAPVV